MAQSIGARSYHECSALLNEGVDETFEAATRAAMLVRANPGSGGGGHHGGGGGGLGDDGGHGKDLRTGSRRRDDDEGGGCCGCVVL